MSRFSELQTSKIAVTDVRKSGDWYTVRGVVSGQPASVDLPASSVEGRTRDDAYDYFKYSLYTVTMEGL